MNNPHEIEVYVRFCETDAIGHVNNTSHFLYLEEARTKFFKEVYPNRPVTKTFMIAKISCTYLNEAFSGQTLTINTVVSKIGTTSFTIEQTIENKENNVMVAEAETVIVWFDYENKKSLKIPEILYDNLKKYSPTKVNKEVSQ